jgi:hypothetical protein
MGWKKFIKKNPDRNERGINSVVMTVSVFITSFIRVFTAERYVSSALTTRSRRLSVMSYSRTRWSYTSRKRTRSLKAPDHAPRPPAVDRVE